MLYPKEAELDIVVVAVSEDLHDGVSVAARPGDIKPIVNDAVEVAAELLECLGCTHTGPSILGAVEHRLEPLEARRGVLKDASGSKGWECLARCKGRFYQNPVVFEYFFSQVCPAAEPLKRKHEYARSEERGFTKKLGLFVVTFWEVIEDWGLWQVNRRELVSPI